MPSIMMTWQRRQLKLLYGDLGSFKGAQSGQGPGGATNIKTSIILLLTSFSNQDQHLNLTFSNLKKKHLVYLIAIHETWKIGAQPMAPALKTFASEPIHSNWVF